MLILLPPSESKRPGGVGTASDPGRFDVPLQLPQLQHQSLNHIREQLIHATMELAGTTDDDLRAAATALKVGPKLLDEVARNRTLTTSPTMPALDRFTGVLFDALGPESLTDEERAFADRTVAIHSALFGLIGALDPIPAYRLSHDSRLPGIRLKALWAPVIGRVLADRDELIIDLRSEAYAALGPIPSRPGAHFVRVVADDGEGRRRALNHFNKRGKGEFVRAVIQSGIEHADVDSLCAWSTETGFPMHLTEGGELELVVAGALATMTR